MSMTAIKEARLALVKNDVVAWPPYVVYFA